MPNAGITLWSGTDICDRLDFHSELRRSFPQLLSLRDLQVILADVVNREVIQRSEGAIAAAAEYVDTFVPTSAYEKTWAILRQHNFAVLHGPAEMGKTAVAWMIALNQITQGWDAIVCQSPEDYFKSVDEKRSQIFIADDAFGRTEYDPTAVFKWEKQLHYILQRLDPKHWLIWTSRKHLLERARQSMDLQSKAGAFPSPGAVLVDASKLSLTEKALILYRHSKHSVLTRERRELVKQQALDIVRNPDFTPERIRRFVVERLPTLMDEGGHALIAPEQLQAEVAEAISNPTKRMRTSFIALDKQQKALLISMLEAYRDRRRVN